MPTVSELREYVGTSTTDNDFLHSCIEQGQALVVAYVGRHSVPDTVFESCVLQVAAEVFHRRQAPNGIAQFSTMDGAPIRVARDPMTSVYPILGRYVGQGV
jgi:hypothetical protein